MNVHIVISFDFGLKGDYSGFYSWLDEHNAKECGNGLAALTYSVDNTSFDQVYNQLKSEIQEKITLDKTDRIYMIMKDGEDGNMKGKFLFGSRKRAPWEGFFIREPSSADIFE